MMSDPLLPRTRHCQSFRTCLAIQKWTFPFHLPLIQRNRKADNLDIKQTLNSGSCHCCVKLLVPVTAVSPSMLFWILSEIFGSPRPCTVYNRKFSVMFLNATNQVDCKAAPILRRSRSLERSNERAGASESRLKSVSGSRASRENLTPVFRAMKNRQAAVLQSIKQRENR